EAALLDARVRAFLNLNDATAADDAVAAVVASGEDAVAHGGAGDLVGRLGPVVLLPVLDRPVAHLDVRRNATGGAERAEALGGAHDLLAQVLQVPVQAGVVRDGEGLRTAHGDGLQVLRTHNRAQARTADGATILSVDHDRGVAHQLFSGRADAGDAGFLSAPTC